MYIKKYRVLCGNAFTTDRLVTFSDNKEETKRRGWELNNNLSRWNIETGIGVIIKATSGNN